MERLPVTMPLPIQFLLYMLIVWVTRQQDGPEFASKALHAWAYRRGVKLHFIDLGKPVQNAFIESFNSTCRNDCLNQELFVDLADARRKIENWRRYYNE